MAQTYAKLTKYPGGRDVWGGRGIFFASYSGPASYFNGGGAVNLNGEIIDSIGGTTELGPANTPQRNIEAIPPVVTVSGTYMVVFAPTAAPVSGAPRRWYARWFTMSGMTEVANATDLHLETAIVMIIGG
jgi:hypothetical protein